MNDTVRLLDRHPLLRRLTGQVIWLMFEEREADPADIQPILQAYEEVKERTADLIRLGREAQNGKADGFVRIDMDRDANVCDLCRRVSGKIIRLDDPRLPTLLPPYGLGCAAIARRIDAVGDEDIAHSEVLWSRFERSDKLLCSETFRD